ncbi:hypothetical protein NEFER03_1901 [Nematocida sp. LUAm3]|nr:hypothetical protein NEFER03_1901 [Nematocida sp. LUAm3]KAI5173948.1 hypothetical protein NEFER02_0415 [Nematocida sp. LUAm2]KAI5177307.1 hypothetical protein NEFER01_0582 [Nematocida sp. LUAm1]
MKLLERISQIVSKTQKEEEEIYQAIAEYIRRKTPPPQIVLPEIAPETPSSEVSSKFSSKKKSHLLVVSEAIEEALSEPFKPLQTLTIEEKVEAIKLLNKRVSQINNTWEKVRMIGGIVMKYLQEHVIPQKKDSFLEVLIGRISEQARNQVSTNKNSALGYAMFLVFLSQYFPSILPMYRRSTFSAVVPLDCLLGMYRIYFHVLKETGNLEEAWTFIASLLNYNEEVVKTFNPGIIPVFLDVLDEKMDEKYTGKWKSIKKLIKEQYIPSLDKKFLTEIVSIESYLGGRK